MGLRKAGANWVEGDRFFDRAAELEALFQSSRGGISDMCRRLGRLVPHDVQRFFECVEVHLRRFRRREASLEDVEQVYANEMFSVRGSMDMNHYENRRKVLLGAKGG